MEEFKTIPSHPDFEISRSGVVRRKKDGKVRVNCMGKYYLVVSISLNGKPCTRLVHRLLGEVYVPNPDNKPQINHKDGNKLNNSIDNLEWTTQPENLAHARKMGLLVNKGEVHKGTKFKDADVQEIRRLISTGVTQAKIAELYGVTQTAIGLINIGRSWKHLPKEAGLSGGRTRRKLLESEVLEIKRLLATGLSYRKVGLLLGIGKNTVFLVHNGRAHGSPDPVKPEPATPYVPQPVQNQDNWSLF